MSKFSVDLGSRQQADPRLLTHPAIPRSLWGLNPRTLMGREDWDTLRGTVFSQSAYHCYACGVHIGDAWRHNWLEGHETYTYDERTKVAELDRVVGLCHRCHRFIHAGNLQNDPEYSRKDVLYVLHTGFDLLKGADLLAEANIDSRAVLRLFDPIMYEDLYGDAVVGYYPLPQDGWVLRWGGYLWKRVLDHTLVKPDDSTTRWIYAKVNDKGGLYYEL